MAKAFWVTGAFAGRIAPATLAAASSGSPDTEIRVQTRYSGISRGTEALVFANRVPESEFQSMRAPFQEGYFPFPVKYGYANVGRVIDGPDALRGQNVFSLFPHQDEFVVPATAVHLLPEGLPPERAILAANMETAVNVLWDASPKVGDRIAVVGLGVVGCLVAWLARQIPGVRLTAVDTNPGRSVVAEALGINFVNPIAIATMDDHDLVIHTSGHPDGLESSLALCGQEAKLVEVSWYGEQSVAVPLGRAFHSRRLTIRSSQVGHLNPERTPRWDYGERMSLALRLLQNPELDCLITGESPFERLPDVMASLTGHSQSPDMPVAEGTLCHRVVY